MSPQPSWQAALSGIVAGVAWATCVVGLGAGVRDPETIVIALALVPLAVLVSVPAALQLVTGRVHRLVTALLGILLVAASFAGGLLVGMVVIIGAALLAASGPSTNGRRTPRHDDEGLAPRAVPRSSLERPRVASGLAVMAEALAGAASVIGLGREWRTGAALATLPVVMVFVPLPATGPECSPHGSPSSVARWRCRGRSVRPASRARSQRSQPWRASRSMRLNERARSAR